ncbi:hypothetical protein C1H46_016133 [Malus baccata]|uniref:WAT1-related protein n=1 Tax=Malus baccata TaxID=106549 RepID=A0A540MJF6_MALBA|nr:hypothetical protein C1H46_016133 [Malus baccata]
MMMAAMNKLVLVPVVVGTTRLVVRMATMNKVLTKKMNQSCPLLLLDPHGVVAQWTIGVSIPLIAGSTTIVCTRSKGITFDVFNFFTNILSFLMLLLATIILRTPFPKLTPCLFIRILGLHVFDPIYYLLAIGYPRIDIFYIINLQTQSILIRKKSVQTKLGALIITFGGAFLIGKYNGPTNAAHQVLYKNWTWPLCLVVTSVLCSACYNVLMENTMEKYDVETLWLATIVRFSAMTPSLVNALATTHGRAYNWVMGLGLQHVLLGIHGLSIFHWGEYRSTSKEEARVEEERLRWRLNLRRRFKLWRRFELMRRNLMHVQKEDHFV